MKLLKPPTMVEDVIEVVTARRRRTFSQFYRGQPGDPLSVMYLSSRRVPSRVVVQVENGDEALTLLTVTAEADKPLSLRVLEIDGYVLRGVAPIRKMSHAVYECSIQQFEVI